MIEQSEGVHERSWAGVVAVWVVAALSGIAIGVFAAPDARFALLGVALAACVLITFIIQLASGVTAGYLTRVSISTSGALVVLVLCSIVIGIASLSGA